MRSMTEKFYNCCLTGRGSSRWRRRTEPYRNGRMVTVALILSTAGSRQACITGRSNRGEVQDILLFFISTTGLLKVAAILILRVRDVENSAGSDRCPVAVYRTTARSGEEIFQATLNNCYFARSLRYSEKKNAHLWLICCAFF